MKQKSDIKYIIKSNNYIGLLFFALVFASLLYIMKHENETFKELEPPTHQIIAPTENKKEILELTPEIENLLNYLNKGDSNTFKIYQSFYVYNEKISKEQLNTETMLYIAYKSIENTTDFTNYIKYITCAEATLVNIDTQIIQCGGSKIPITNYTINTYITKDTLKNKIKEIFNLNINSFTNFYTNENNLCYFINNEYLCIQNTKTSNPTTAEKQFVKAYKSNNKLEIYEKYKYIKEGIYYKGFNSNEVGEGLYKTTFIKTNGQYYWESTEYIQED